MEFLLLGDFDAWVFSLGIYCSAKLGTDSTASLQLNINRLNIIIDHWTRIVGKRPCGRLTILINSFNVLFSGKES